MAFWGLGRFGSEASKTLKLHGTSFCLIEVVSIVFANRV